ncbi:Reprolysin (M12B) family zinc metalloprotease [Planctomycetes bacterium Poly30]|uniref:Reprolysin (M12B) family zinc metalloprotease n=1 Tax=Saltatorellus ferox TaxID=2528018 RepID=A0A518EPA2_9BACT|nr:Reprolysin (M12B) family zinc metalloprotease [Planctomycetes bacterium Poly30]
MLPILSSLALLAAPQAVPPVGSLQQLDVPTAATGTVTIAVELDGEFAQLVLERHSLRAADFKLFATRPDGTPVEMPAPIPNTWRGYIEGRTDSLVTASITSEGLSAIASDYGSEVEWQIQPAEGFDADVYSVARLTEIDSPTGICGVPNGPLTITPGLNGQPGTSSSFLGTGLQLTEIALDADFEMFQRNGNSVSATVDDLERVMNRVDTIYTRDVDVTFQITALVVRSSSNDPYSTNDAGTVLDQFRNHWNANFVGVRKDTAHLFTGRSMNGSVIGLAYVGVICNSSTGYGLSESRFTNNIGARTGLTAHEIGHNFNASHCDGNGDCRIMCSGLGGCQGDVTRFGNPSANGIRNYAISRNCLLDLSPALALPVFDDVEGGLNRDIWISQQGVSASTAAVGEPSGTQSLEMDALNASPELDDVLISNYILLGSVPQAFVSFESQHRGVPIGGQLVLEIYDSSRDWIELARLSSDGIDQNTFESTTVMVPAAGLHDKAQLRFRTEVNGTSENWFIDDIRVADMGCGSITNYCVAGPNSVSALGGTLQGFGSTSIAANDLLIVGFSLPPSSFGIWLYAENQIQNPLGDGFLCVSGQQIFRVSIAQTNLFGENSLALDQNNLAAGSVINPGDTFNFQVWYRDTTSAGYNLSDALSVVFCP